MAVTELYNVATWSFVMGQRDVEEALLDPSLRSLVVRGGVGTVLPTLAAIRELRGGPVSEGVSRVQPSGPPLDVHVPSNALSAALPDLSRRVRGDQVLPLLLSETYGVRVAARVPEDELVVAFVSGAVPGLERVPSLVLGMPGGGPVPEPMRGLVAGATSTFRWDGRNAFLCAAVEEAVCEAAPPRLTVVSDDPARLFFTAVGAVDCLLVEDARYRDPSRLQLWDVLEVGSRVTAVLLQGAWGATSEGTVLEHVLRLMTEELGVTSVLPDFAYGPVAGHKIAIDLG